MDKLIDVLPPQPCDPFRHEWREEYYGYRCTKCEMFVPYGCEPWMPDGWDAAEEEDEYYYEPNDDL